MKRKMLSILLALCMVCSLLPTMAFAEEHHACDAFCGHVDGDPHKTVDSEEWTPWNSTTTPPSSGNYYLTEDVILSEPCTVSGTLNLCLNGHTITPSGSGFSAIKITGNLSLTDCKGTGKITGFTNTAGKGGAVYSEGTFTMYGGIISGNTVINQYFNDGMGGGVYSGGTFTMYGGTISDNKASFFGGGVYVAPGKQFTMDGGTISGNEVTTTGNAQNYGGGGVYSDGTFTMSGGIIKNNKANTMGGGVCISNIPDSTATSTFTMHNGTISGNKAPDGGGVYIDSGKQFTMHNGTISGNTSTAFGGGVCVYGTFTMNNGTIGGNNAGYGGGVNIGYSDSFTMTGGNITGNAATNYGGGVYMYEGAKAFELSGSPIISGNTGGNCYIDNDDTCMTVTGPLGENAKIGITTWDQMSSRPFCKPADNSINLGNYKDWFFSDIIGHDILQNGDGSLYTVRVTTYALTFDSTQAKVTVRDIETTKAAEGDTVVISPKGDAVIESVTVSRYCDVTDRGDGTYSFTMPANSVTITVTFPAPPTYTVTFDANGATGTAPTAQTVTSGETATEPADPTADGYTFGGWYTDRDCTVPFNFNTAITGNTTLYAKWTAVPAAETYTITLDRTNYADGYLALYTFNKDGSNAGDPILANNETVSMPTDGFVRVFAGEEFSVTAGAATVSSMKSSDDSYYYEITDFEGDTTIVVKPAAAPTPPTATDTDIPTYYNLWIGGVQVTSANEDNIVVPGASGKATYDPTNNTLTLTNFQYAGEHENGSDYETSAISVKEDGITIIFSGENMIEGTGDCGLYADVEDYIKLKAADKNSTLTFTCNSTRAFWHIPVLVGEIDIYAGSNEADAAPMESEAFADYPYYDFKYVKFVPATPTPEPDKPVIKPTTPPSYDPTPVIPSVDVDVHDDSLSAAAKAVGSAVKSGNADIIPTEGYTKESIAKMQSSGELNLVIEKNAGYDEAEKKLLDDAITAKGGAAGSVMYLEIDALLMSDDGKVVAEVDDTIVPLTITVDLNAEMQKAAKEGKTIYVARAHDGKVAFIEGTLNADKTKLTFDSSKFSTYALVASDGATITSAQTADAGIFLAVSMSVLSVTGSAVLLKKKED